MKNKIKLEGYTINRNKIKTVNVSGGFEDITAVVDQPVRAIYSCGFYSVIIRIKNRNCLSDLEFSNKENANTMIKYLTDQNIRIMGEKSITKYKNEYYQ